MCTRYYMDDASSKLTEFILSTQNSTLARHFLHQFGKPVISSGEVRPTDIVPVIAPDHNGKRAVFPMKWGFTDKIHKFRVFNARIENANSKPTFKDAWFSHRCIVPASYYFEWQHFKSPNGRMKTGDKYAIQPAGADTTWLCGLYRIEEGFPVFVVLTREPSKEVSTIHDRMPLMLPEDLIDKWISPASIPGDLLPYALTDMIIEKT